jgi:hypothetical protein
LSQQTGQPSTDDRGRLSPTANARPLKGTMSSESVHGVRRGDIGAQPFGPLKVTGAAAKENHYYTDKRKRNLGKMNCREDIKGALYRVVTAIATVQNTDGVQCRQAYSELIAATCHAQRVLHEDGFPAQRQDSARGVLPEVVEDVHVISERDRITSVLRKNRYAQ